MGHKSKHKDHKSEKNDRLEKKRHARHKEERNRRSRSTSLERHQRNEQEKARKKNKSERTEKEKLEKKKQQEKELADVYMGYSNESNPFGDERLLETFVWKKKLDKDGVDNFKDSATKKLLQKKVIENKRELEKVKERRLEREKELEDRRNMEDLEQRNKEVEYHELWEKQEDSFHLTQAKLRSQIRIKDSRAKPIDLLAQYNIAAENHDFSIEMQEPYKYLLGLTIADLEDLIEDISVYRELEKDSNAEYWRDITVICQDELDKLHRIAPVSEHVGERRTGINESVNKDVQNIFKGKSLVQLELLEKQIGEKLKGGEGIDVTYWETLAKQLKAYIARTRIQERHHEMLQKKLQQLKKEQGIYAKKLFPIEARAGLDDRPTAGSSSSASTNNEPEPPPRVETAELRAEEKVDEAVVEYVNGRYSPVLLDVSELPADVVVIKEEDDRRRLLEARKRVTETGVATDDLADLDMLKKARDGMTEDEASFGVEVVLQKKAMVWSDKYKPRKPKFFNRVHTGFEWNKYNQTHYDIDNPPPKIVQGYKFNIFYPDLIDKTIAPEYKITSCEENPEFGILRFHAGAPYEDIAFKIVNREWENSYKRGFRCQFQNNIFQLWFHFKKYRYRR